MKSNLVVNFFGGPGIGKTVAACDLYSSLKKHDVMCQLIGEFAQECILAGNEAALEDQAYILGNTYHRILTSYRQVPVTITDSPILMQVVYRRTMPESFDKFVVDLHNQFNNFNVLLERRSGYQHTMVGRVHSLTESIGLDKEIERLLDQNSILYIRESDLGEDPMNVLTEQIIEFLAELTEYDDEWMDQNS